MQKINKKASILIWSIFLSLIISISFLSISTKITKNLKNNNSNNTKILEENRLQNILNTSENDSEIEGNKIIYLENKHLKKSLKKNEIYTIHFPNTSIIDLELTSSGIIQYEYIGNSGILNNNNTSLNTTINSSDNLILTNYTGHVSFELYSDNKFDIPEKKYKIIETIGNKKIIKTSGIIN